MNETLSIIGAVVVGLFAGWVIGGLIIVAVCAPVWAWRKARRP